MLGEPPLGELVRLALEVVLHLRHHAERGDGGAGVEQCILDAVGVLVGVGEAVGVGPGEVGAHHPRCAPVGVVDHHLVGAGDELVEGRLLAMDVGDQGPTFHRHDRGPGRLDLRGVPGLRGVEHLVHLGVGELAGTGAQTVERELVGEGGQALHRLGRALRKRL